MEQSRAATAKQLRMALLVARMEQKESPQQRIGRHFGGAHQMAPAICLGFGETEQLARSPRRIEPHPPMEWSQQYPHHFHEKIGNTGIAPIHEARPGPALTSWVPGKSGMVHGDRSCLGRNRITDTRIFRPLSLV